MLYSKDYIDDELELSETKVLTFNQYIEEIGYDAKKYKLKEPNSYKYFRNLYNKNDVDTFEMSWMEDFERDLN